MNFLNKIKIENIEIKVRCPLCHCNVSAVIERRRRFLETKALFGREYFPICSLSYKSFNPTSVISFTKSDRTICVIRQNSGF